MCSQTLKLGMTTMKDEPLSIIESMLLALSDPTRLRLLSLMGPDEVSVGFLSDTLGQSQPKISRHLAYLRGAGLVSTRRDGKWIYYRIIRPDHAAGRRLLSSALEWAGSAISGGEVGQKTLAWEDTQDDSHGPRYVPQEIEIHLL